MLTLNEAILLDKAFEKLTKALGDEIKVRRDQNLLLDKNYRYFRPIIQKWMNYTNSKGLIYPIL